jgi:hypothetical protein
VSTLLILILRLLVISIVPPALTCRMAMFLAYLTISVDIGSRHAIRATPTSIRMGVAIITTTITTPVTAIISAVNTTIIALLVHTIVITSLVPTVIIMVATTTSMIETTIRVATVIRCKRIYNF